MIFIGLIFVAFVLALIISFGSIFFEIKRLALVGRAQMAPVNFSTEVEYSKMSVWEASRSILTGRGDGSDFRVRVAGDSLSGIGIRSGDLLALRQPAFDELLRPITRDDGSVFFASGLTFRPNETVVLLPYSRHDDENARRFSQKLRCFVSLESVDGRWRILSRKLTSEGVENRDWHNLEEVIGIVYYNISSGRAF